MKVGAAKRDITALDDCVSLLGWGVPKNSVFGVALPIFARAFVFENSQSDFAFYLVADNAFPARSLRVGILEEVLRRRPDIPLQHGNFMLTATHTHSAPGGYTWELFYNLQIPGFSPHVLNTFVSGCADALIAAWDTRRDATLSYGTIDVPTGERVVFNRSIKAYNANRDTEKLSHARRDEAVDRTMRALVARDEAGRPFACLSWFAVHCTSIHSDNKLIHGDNKGAAAAQLEAEYAKQGVNDFVAGFAQGAAGDASPNFRMSWRRYKMVGEFDDDDRSARYNGEIQARYARAVIDASANEEPLNDAIDHSFGFVHMTGFEIDPEYALGQAGRRTGSGIIGVGFIEGTAEGPGPLRPIRFVNRAITRLLDLRASWLRRRGQPVPHRHKVPFLETGRGRHGLAFGIATQGDPKIPGFIHQTVAVTRHLKRNDGLDEAPWVSNSQPVHIIRIGELAIVGLPGEPTTTAGRRVNKQVIGRLADIGVKHVVVNGYANGYAGYTTTPEEYGVQLYEGCTTFFGEWTLGAYQTKLDELCSDLHRPKNQRPAAEPYPDDTQSAAVLAVQSFRSLRPHFGDKEQRKTQGLLPQ